MSDLALRHGLQWGLLGLTARRISAEYQLMCVFPPPYFDTTLQRSEQFNRISIWLLRLKPFQQFSRRPPGLGVEPFTHLRRHRQEWIRASALFSADFLLPLTCGTHLTLLP